MFIDWALADDAPDYGSWGNGAPMRVAAVGWLAHDEREAVELAASQAVVSHDHTDAVAASQAVALAILLARSGLSRANLRRRLVKDFGYHLEPDRVLQPREFDISTAGTVPSALAAALSAQDWEDAIRTAVCLGGDTDTPACITGSVAEAIHGLPDNIGAIARSYLTADLYAVLSRFEALVQSATG